MISPETRAAYTVLYVVWTGARELQVTLRGPDRIRKIAYSWRDAQVRVVLPPSWLDAVIGEAEYQRSIERRGPIF